MVLPIYKSSNCRDLKGQLYKWEIKICPSLDQKMYPEGVKAVFRLLRINKEGENELVILIDNHTPYGFHEHNKLPSQHDSRVSLNVECWKQALDIFQKKCQAVLK